MIERREISLHSCTNLPDPLQRAQRSLEGTLHDETRKSSICGQGPHNRWTRWCLTQRRWSSRHQTVTAGNPRRRHRPRAIVCCRWSVCFLSAIGIVASKMKIALPVDSAIDTEGDLGVTDGSFFLQARLNLSPSGFGSPGCPGRGRVRPPDLSVYSKATGGNIDVVISVV